MQEGLFLYERGLDPYDGGIFHQAPLLLPLFSLLPSASTWIGRLISIVLYTGLDVLTANCLYGISESGAAYTSRLYSSPRKDRSWQPISVAAVSVVDHHDTNDKADDGAATSSTLLLCLPAWPDQPLCSPRSSRS